MLEVVGRGVSEVRVWCRLVRVRLAELDLPDLVWDLEARM